MKISKSIGIFGGAFDPIHLGHIIPIMELRARYSLDKVIYIPTFISNSKKNIEATPEQRLEMLKISLQNRECEIDKREIDNKNISYTIDTLNSITQDFPDYKLIVIIGQDNLVSLPDWKDFEKVLSLCNIIVMNRQTSNDTKQSYKYLEILKNRICSDQSVFNNQSNGNIIIEQTTSINITSTHIREKLRRGEPIEGLVDKKLENWLKQNRIYQ